MVPIHSQTYPNSPENPHDVWIFQKEQWCKPVVMNGNDNEVILEWEDETEQSVKISLQIGVARLIADKEIRNWAEFHDLVTQWKKERGSRSLITQAVSLDPYLKIIGMGPRAVPLIIAQLKSEGDRPDQWFTALRVITKKNPVKPEDRGDFPKMSRAWVEWWESQDWEYQDVW
jgi:hypothetical protein